MAYPSESQESWNVLLLLQNRFFILEITIELAHKFQLLWGIEKKNTNLQKFTCALGNRQNIFEC